MHMHGSASNVGELHPKETSYILCMPFENTISPSMCVHTMHPPLCILEQQVA